ncbi:Peptidoglycan-binding domain 1 protein [Nostoc sp. NIES-3756]|uniref:peptidoglycan-binding domain-containing protein n=1 Tax=Nostoc sp. NIES-3756 TaxID=1751286 RepID=UPI0007206D8D|nr:peptidoglycan-binding protein [Nostoc sp. NIES-3756]BAT55441.1 Peptidoglycan-binding domain 1 protein [Nostoc sp. NIES-3756]BAY36796.1 peptidoglycan-binding domain 1 protein [Nostoc sp. NIES-2111]
MSFKIEALQLPTLQRGSEGRNVTVWQRFLLDNDFSIGAVDGDFGNVSDKATREYQTKNGLRVTGIVDIATYQKALTQGFAVYIAFYGNGVTKFLSYLNFGDNEVKDLQKSLTAIATLNPPLVVDGDFGANSIRGLAEAYKKRDVNFPDDLAQKLSTATKAKLGDDFAPALNNITAYAKRLRERLSGKNWINSFLDRDSIDDLASPFRQKVRAFERALQDAGATISVASVLRPPERAYLMHYAFRISRNEIAAQNVPPMPNVDINWVHYNNAISIQAAKDMVYAYNIAYRPVLTSRHTRGLAIDWEITWNGTLKVKNANGNIVNIGEPCTSYENSALWQVGRSYGVIKLASDRPHWSSDGH